MKPRPIVTAMLILLGGAIVWLGFAIRAAVRVPGVMSQLADAGAMLIAMWGALLPVLLTAVVRSRGAQPEPYLKRVEKKYSISPLDLR